MHFRVNIAAQGLLALVLTGLTVSLAPAFGFAQTFKDFKNSRWVKYWDSQYGFVVQYPPTIFEPLAPTSLDPEDEENQGVRFISKDGEAVIWAWGTLNTRNRSLLAYKKFVSEKAKRIGTITYKPNGDNWFALSGYKGERIFYRKVIMSCNGYVINSLHIEFPRDMRKLYDPIIEHLENHFRPGRGNYTPVDC